MSQEFDDADEQVLREEEAKFERALGRFVMTYADAEAELYRVLVRYAEVSDAVARATFSGMRAKGMMDTIRAIAHNTKLDPARLTDLEFVFAQLASINTTRDQVVHFSSTQLLIWSETTSRVLTNVERVRRYGGHFETQIGSKTLDAMTYDLQAICNHLNLHWGGLRSGPFKPWEENAGEPTTWCYKPTPTTKAMPKAKGTERKP